MINFSRSTLRGHHKLPYLISVVILMLVLFYAPLAAATLNISATNSVNPARSSEFLHVEFTVSNTDAFARSAVVVTMTYPPNLNQLFESDFDGDCASTTCTNGETVSWAVGNLPAGSSITLSMDPFVTAGTANGTVITFAPTVVDGLLDTNSTSLDVDVDSDTLYDLAMSENSDPALAGAMLTYTLNFAYLADAATVSNSTLRFNVPSNATFVSATGGGIHSAGDVDWPLGFLSPGDGGVRQVTMQLDGSLGAADVVQASGEIFSVATPTENAVSLTNTSIAGTAGLQLAIESNTSPVRSTDLNSMIMTVSNHDPFERFNVVLRANLPQSTTQLFESNFSGDCTSTTCTEGERIIWALGNIPAGGSTSVFLPPIVAANTLGGTLISLHATAIDAAGLEARQSEAFRVQTDHIYELSLAENSDPAIAGSPLTYTLNFGYRSDASAVNDSTLSFQIPDGATFVSASHGGSLNSNTVEWALGFLSPGQGGARDVTVSLESGLAAATVILADAEVFSVTDSIESARAQANTVIAASSGLQLSIESNTNPSRAGEPLNMEVTVTNTDGFERFNVQLITNFPQDLAQLFETQFEGDCASTTCTLQERVTWSLGNIPAGGSVTTTFPPILSAVTVGGSLIPFVAQAQDDQGVQTRQTDTLRVQNNSLYDLALSENSDPAVAGSALNYVLTFGYLEDAAAVNNSSLRFPIPVGTTFVSATDGGVLNSGAVEWPLGFLSPGDGGQREVVVQTSGALSASSMINAIAEVSSITSPIQSARAEADTVIAATRGLQTVIEPNANPGRKGELVNYRVTVSNHDAFTRFGVVVTGHLPPDALQLFETQFEGDCASTTCTSGELITWTVGNIPAGESKSVDLPPIISVVTQGGTLVNLHTVATDDQGIQARRMESLRVQGDTLYDLHIAGSADPAVPGASLTYRLTYGYREDAGQVNNSTLRLPIPDGAVFLSATDSGAFNGSNVEWNLGFLSPGDGGTVSASVLLDNGLTAGTVVEAAAELFSVTSPVERARSRVNTVIRDNISLALNINAITFTAEPNRELNLELSVTNLDAFTRFGVELNARYPQDLAQLFESNPDFFGDCSSTTCLSGELIKWPLVDIPAGQTVTVTLPPTVAFTAVEGSLINFLAWANDDLGVETRSSQSLYQGCLVALDGDCDGIANTSDNCSIVANTNQRNTDGDGFGNICDPDLDNSGSVNFVDISLFAQRFQTADEDADLNGDGAVNFIDFAIVASFFLSPPGPGATAE